MKLVMLNFSLLGGCCLQNSAADAGILGFLLMFFHFIFVMRVIHNGDSQMALFT
jgi:hypothetical protein